jgi:hypothetical protein
VAPPRRVRQRGQELTSPKPSGDALFVEESDSHRDRRRLGSAPFARSSQENDLCGRSRCRRRPPAVLSLTPLSQACSYRLLVTVNLPGERVRRRGGKQAQSARRPRAVATSLGARRTPPRTCRRHRRFVREEDQTATLLSRGTASSYSEPSPPAVPGSAVATGCAGATKLPRVRTLSQRQPQDPAVRVVVRPHALRGDVV